MLNDSRSEEELLIEQQTPADMEEIVEKWRREDAQIRLPSSK